MKSVQFASAFACIFVMVACAKSGGSASAQPPSSTPSANVDSSAPLVPPAALQPCGSDIVKEHNSAQSVCALEDLSSPELIKSCIAAEAKFLKDYPSIQCVGPSGEKITSQNAKNTATLAAKLLPQAKPDVPAGPTATPSPTPGPQTACTEAFESDYKKAQAPCDRLITLADHKSCQASFSSLLKKYPQTSCATQDERGKQILITPRTLEGVVLSMQASIDSMNHTLPGSSGSIKPLPICSAKVASDYNKNLAPCFQTAQPGDLDTPRLQACEKGCEAFLAKNSGVDCKIYPSTEVSTAGIQYQIQQLKALIETSATQATR